MRTAWFKARVRLGLHAKAVSAVLCKRVRCAATSGALACAVLLLASNGSALAQPNLAGDWHGVLATPIGKLNLLAHFDDAGSGAWRGYLESVDQAPGQKIPVVGIATSADKEQPSLRFSIPAIGAEYGGVWNEADQSWVGTFKQSATMPLALKRGKPSLAPSVVGLDGDWRGNLRRGEATLRLILRVRSGANGTTAFLDSPDANAMGLVVQGFERTDGNLHFAVPAANVTFVGKLDAGVRQFNGVWQRQGLPDAQVTFLRDQTQPAEKLRSQWPLKTATYLSIDVSFANPVARGVTLAGTLTLPIGAGPFPAAILLTGSGPQDRDETVFGHKPFAVLADELTRRGIAVLRYDDRGVAASTGTFAQATSADFATDANAAFAFLMARQDIDRHAIGMVGHSEGGMVGPLAALTNPKIAFMVLLAAPGTSADQLLASQRRVAGRAQGMTEKQLDDSELVWDELTKVVQTAQSSELAAERLRLLLTPQATRRVGVSESAREGLIAQLSDPWLRYLLNYKPGEVLAQMRMPVLALNGALDRQVPAADNLAAIRKALATNADATAIELAGLNHLFQTAKTGTVSEYADIAETFSPAAMDTIAAWLLARFGVARKP